MNGKRGWLGAALAVVALAAGPVWAQGPGPGQPQRGGTLTIGLFFDPTPIDPLGSNAVAERTVAQAVFDALVDVSPSGEVQPRLATKWQSDDGATWLLDLRTGVTFHDGTPFNAAAVKAHFDRLFAPGSKCVATCAEIDTFAGATVRGEHQIELKLKSPSAAFISALSGYAGMIVSPTAAEKLGDKFGAGPVGAGPFKWIGRAASGEIRLERHPGYWQADKPYVDNLVYRPIPDAQARLAAVASGQVDLMHEPGVTERMDAKARGLQVIDVGALGTKFVILHTAKRPFDDIRARLAVAHATDADLINETLHHRMYRSTKDPFPNGQWADSEPANYPKPDLEKARKLVQELGGLSFQMDVGPSPDMLLAQVLQDQWRQAGIRVEINKLETATYIDRGLKGDYVASLFSWSGRWDPDLNTYSFFKSGSPRNYTRLSDPKVDELIEKGRRTLDQPGRKAAYAELNTRLAELMPYVYLYSQDKAYIATNRVRGVQALGDAIIRPDTIWLAR